MQTDAPQTQASTGKPKTKMTFGEIVRVLLMAAFIVGGLLLLHATPWGRKMTFGNVELFRHWLAQWGHWAWLIFLVLGTALLAFGFPRILLAFIAGATFGILWGTVLAELTTTISAIPAFYYTFFLGREMVTRRLGGRLQKFNLLLKRHGFVVLLLVRLCPVGNAFITNCLAGLSAIAFRDYILSSAIGFLPMSFIFALLGGSFVKNFHSRLWSSAGLLIAFSLIFIWYFNHSTLARDVMDVMRDNEREGEC